MVVWVVLGLVAAIVAGTVTWPLLRTKADRAEEQPDVYLYRAQMAEVERDLARGTLGEEEAERARTEIARRLLAADRAGTRQAGEAPPMANRVLAALVVAVVALGGLGLYAVIGTPRGADLPRAARLAASESRLDSRMSQEQAEAEARAMPQPPAPEIPDDYVALIERLRQIVPTRPEDIEGWRLLARHEAQTGNFAAAARAQERVVELLGAEAGDDELTYLVDLMVAAAAGYVSTEAEELARGVLARSEGDPAARYSLGLLYAQADRPDLAVSLWRPVAETGDPAAIHTRLARDQIELAAQAAGLDYALPAPRGPSAADIAAAEDLDPAARQAMIRDMVGQLSQRLASEGGPASDWARLISSLAVLGETEQARTILSEARAVFAASESDLGVIDAAADSAGLGG